jgi:hypothetical protein
MSLLLAGTLPLIGGLPARAAAGCGPTALEALTAVAETLSLRHPNGAVKQIYTLETPVAGRSRTWGISVWAPERSLTLHYEISKDALSGPMAVSSFHAELLPVVHVLGQGVPEHLLDSSAAVQLAENYGAAEFSTRTGAQLARIGISGEPAGNLVWDVGYMNPGTTFHLIVFIDAVTGGLLSFEDQSRGHASDPGA